jgi:hypothetical protein
MMMMMMIVVVEDRTKEVLAHLFNFKNNFNIIFTAMRT